MSQIATAMESRPVLPRIKVFMDFWNFQLTINDREAKARGVADVKVKLDWKGLGMWLARKAAETAGLGGSFAYEGGNIYASYNPQTSEDKRLHKWLTTWLNRQPGVHVECLERQPKAPPKCPVCHRTIENCPHAGCGAKMVGTIEKGVDTFIATDMIRLAWENAYEIAVLASSDRDLVPAVKFLDQKAKKVIQAGFPPTGVQLATACWASFDVFPMRQEIIRQ
jgi:hypothetical protein